MPRRLVNVPAPFTPHKDGWCRWYKGRPPFEDIEDRWLIKKKKEVDGGLEQAAEQVTGGLCGA